MMLNVSVRFGPWSVRSETIGLNLHEAPFPPEELKCVCSSDGLQVLQQLLSHCKTKVGGQVLILNQKGFMFSINNNIITKQTWNHVRKINWRALSRTWTIGCSYFRVYFLNVLKKLFFITLFSNWTHELTNQRQVFELLWKLFVKVKLFSRFIPAGFLQFSQSQT